MTEPQGFLSLLQVWEFIPDEKIGQLAEHSETPAEFEELIAQYIITGYHEEGATRRRGNLAAWLPWAYAVAHKATMIEEMQDAARFADQEGSRADESVYQELNKRLDSIHTAAFLPDGVLHGRPDDSQDIPMLFMDEQEQE